MTVRVRPATSDDLDAVVALSLRLMESHGETSPRPETVRLGVEAALAGGELRCRYSLGIVEGLPVSQVLVTALWDDQTNAEGWWVRRLFVEEAWRNRGVARALLEHVRRAAQSAGNVPCLRAHVFRENVRSQRLFESSGFRRSAIEYSLPVSRSAGRTGAEPVPPGASAPETTTGHPETFV